MKRWLTRNFFIGLLTLCVVAWAGSYCIPFDMEYFEKMGDHVDSFALSDGRIIFDQLDQTVPTGGFVHIWYGCGVGLKWDVTENSAYFDLLGFSAGSRLYTERFISFPIWLPTAMSIWLIWRKTRPNAIAGAFPVEVEKPEAKE